MTQTLYLSVVCLSLSLSAHSWAAAALSTRSGDNPLRSFVRTVGSAEGGGASFCRGSLNDERETGRRFCAATSDMECAEECLGDDKCVSFFYAQKKRTLCPCRLSYNCMEYTHTSEKWTGFMKVEHLKPESALSWFDATIADGMRTTRCQPDEYKTVSDRVDASQCALECLKDPDCIHFAFNDDDDEGKKGLPCKLSHTCAEYTEGDDSYIWDGYRLASLLQEDAAELRPRDFFIRTPPSAAGKSNICEGSSYYRYILDSATEAECARECLRDERCVHFVYTADSERRPCKLSQEQCTRWARAGEKWSGHLRISEIEDPLVLFSHTAADGKTNSFCPRQYKAEDSGYVGKASTETECARECLSLPECVSFAFSPPFKGLEYMVPCKLSTTCTEYTQPSTKWHGYMKEDEQTVLERLGLQMQD